MTVAERPVEPLHRRSASPTTSSTRSAIGSADATRTISSSRCSASCGASTARTRAPSRCSRRCRRPATPWWPGPGENAGVISIGDGLAVAFKIESHNHPSAVEPYQGAATGVGGILRDIFTMGARPIAVLDALRFGDPLGADAAPRRWRGARRRRLRQLRRRADGRWRARVRPDLPGQPARQRDGHRAAGGAAADPRGGARARATWSSCSARRPVATASAGPRSWPARRSPTTTRPRAAVRAGRRPVRGEAADRGVAGAHRARARRRASRTWAPAASPAPRRRRPTAPGRASSSTSMRSRAASRTWSRSR